MSRHDVKLLADVFADAHHWLTAIAGGVLGLMMVLDALQVFGYLKAYDSVSTAGTDIAQYLDGYNTPRPHSSLARRTPDQAYWANLPTMKSAA